MNHWWIKLQCTSSNTQTYPTLLWNQDICTFWIRLWNLNILSAFQDVLLLLVQKVQHVSQTRRNATEITVDHTKGLFTSWTLKLSHVKGFFFPCHPSVVWFLENTIFKAFGFMTRCTLNVDQEKQLCTKKKWMCRVFSLLNVCLKHDNFGNFPHARASPLLMPFLPHNSWNVWQ